MTQRTIDFYDDFVKKQQETSINERILKLFKRMLIIGLRRNSNILELGCGIGTMTYLMSKKNTKGKIEAVDISGKSIDFARKRIRKSNVSFIQSNVVTYRPVIENIDFITLFDVIEHIPVEMHKQLFKNIAAFCNKQTKILINIPNPAYTEYDRIHQPELLQIIDQALPLNEILQTVESAGLEISFFETYSIWVKNDYQFFILNKKEEFNEVKIKIGIFKKITKKIRLTIFKILYNFN